MSTSYTNIPGITSLKSNARKTFAKTKEGAGMILDVDGWRASFKILYFFFKALMTLL